MIVGIEQIFDKIRREDDDLIAFLEGLPPRKRASGIKMSLRSGGALSDLQSTDLEEAEEDMDFDLDDFVS